MSCQLNLLKVLVNVTGRRLRLRPSKRIWWPWPRKRT